MDLDASHEIGAVALVVVDYRCVCGETISLETTTGGQCRGCGRKYASEALRSAAAETISIADWARGGPTPLTAEVVDAPAVTLIVWRLVVESQSNV